MKNTSESIKSILQNYRRNFDKVIQRSELLKRNPLLRQEYSGFKNRVTNTFFIVKDLKDKTIGKISQDNILLKLNYPTVDYTAPLNRKDIKRDRYWKNLINLDSSIYQTPADLREEIENKKYVLKQYQRQWDELCERWLIESEWDGDFQTLEKYTRKPVDY